MALVYNCITFAFLSQYGASLMSSSDLKVTGFFIYSRVENMSLSFFSLYSEVGKSFRRFYFIDRRV
jgi:hypothetical protein